MYSVERSNLKRFEEASHLFNTTQVVTTVVIAGFVGSALAKTLPKEKKNLFHLLSLTSFFAVSFFHHKLRNEEKEKPLLKAGRFFIYAIALSSLFDSSSGLLETKKMSLFLVIILITFVISKVLFFIKHGRLKSVIQNDRFKTELSIWEKKIVDPPYSYFTSLGEFENRFPLLISFITTMMVVGLRRAVLPKISKIPKGKLRSKLILQLLGIAVLYQAQSRTNNAVLKAISSFTAGTFTATALLTATRMKIGVKTAGIAVAAGAAYILFNQMVVQQSIQNTNQQAL